MHRGRDSLPAICLAEDYSLEYKKNLKKLNTKKIKSPIFKIYGIEQRLLRRNIFTSVQYLSPSQK